MCGRYQGIPESDFQAFGLRTPPNYQQSFNVAPGTYQPTIIKGSWKLQTAKWGLVPFWSKEPRTKFSTINARSETIDTSPAYREAFRRRRCLIPASGFFEWKRHSDNTKDPYYIRLKNRESFAFAGVWDSWKDDEGKELVTFSIVTCEANDLMKSIHTRMPVILPRDRHETWANPDTPINVLKKLMAPYDPSNMKAYMVSTRVNSPTNNSPENIKPIIS